MVGAGGTYRPFEFENSEKQLEGFDIDIIKAVAAAEDFDVKLINTPWEGIFATLSAGDRDILISGITITDKRKQMVDFSAPYFPAEQAIVVNENSPIGALSELSKYNVGVVNSSTGILWFLMCSAKPAPPSNALIILRCCYRNYMKTAWMRRSAMSVS